VKRADPIAPWSPDSGSPTLSAAAPLTVELKRNLDLHPDDAVALDSFVGERPQVGIFVSRAWLSGFFNEPPAGVELGLLMLRSGGSLRGVAPIAIRRRLTHVRVELLGAALGSDRTDLVSAPGFGAACADAVLSWLGDTFRTGFVLGLMNAPDDSPFWGAIHRASANRARPLVLEPREVHPFPYLTICKGDYGPARGTAHVPHPASLDKHRRWLARRGRSTIELLHDPAEALLAFDSLVGFLHARWSGHDQPSVLDSARTQRFHRHVIPRLMAESRLRMVRVAADMRTVAVFYGLAIGTWWGYYLAGYDREWAGRIHLGQITLASAIDLAAREGAVEFDFLKGVERVKYLWPVRERVAIDAEVFSGAAGPQWDRAGLAARQTVAALAKSMRSLAPGGN